MQKYTNQHDEIEILKTDEILYDPPLLDNVPSPQGEKEAHSIET